MPIPAHVINALTQFISTAGLEGQAILIGGQAIRDWHDEQAHKLGGIHGVLPTPRATSDIDVHLAVKVNPDAMTAAIMGTWTVLVKKPSRHSRPCPPFDIHAQVKNPTYDCANLSRTAA